MTNFPTINKEYPQGVVKNTGLILTDLDVGLGGLTNVSFVYIESTQPISVKVSEQDLASSKGKVFLYTGSVGGYITEILISNGELVKSDVFLLLGAAG